MNWNCYLIVNDGEDETEIYYFILIFYVYFRLIRIVSIHVFRFRCNAHYQESLIVLCNSFYNRSTKLLCLTRMSAIWYTCTVAVFSETINKDYLEQSQAYLITLPVDVVLTSIYTVCLAVMQLFIFDWLLTILRYGTKVSKQLTNQLFWTRTSAIHIPYVNRHIS